MLNIFLYDIDGDGGSDNGDTPFTMIYMRTEDFLENQAGNAAPSLYVDFGEYQGRRLFEGSDDDKDIMHRSILREYQRLVHHSKQLTNQHHGRLECDPNDLDYIYFSGEMQSSRWYNEGLSGWVDLSYLMRKDKSMDREQLIQYLNNSFPAGTGAIPTSEQWDAAAADTRGMLAYKGAATLLMQEFYYKTHALGSLLTSPRKGYYNSMKNISLAAYNTDDRFDDFFTEAMLNIHVDSPQGVPLRYYTDAVDNIWAFKSDPDNGITQNAFVGGAATFNTNGGTYYADTILADATGENRNAANVSIPEGTEATYYIIMPHDAENITTRAAWDAAPKTVVKLEPGNSATIVGTNNMFAVLAIAHNTACNEQISYRPTYVPPVNEGASGYRGGIVSGKLSATTKTASGNTLTVELFGDGVPMGAILSITNSGDAALHSDCPACAQIRDWNNGVDNPYGKAIAIMDVNSSKPLNGMAQLTFKLGAAYDGKSVTIAHCNNGQLQLHYAMVQDGAMRISVSALSPFAIFEGRLNNNQIAIPEEPVLDPPKTGDRDRLIWVWLLTPACIGVLLCIRRKKSMQ